MKFTLVLVVLDGAENGLSVRVCVGARQEADRNRKIKRKSRDRCAPNAKGASANGTKAGGTIDLRR